MQKKNKLSQGQVATEFLICVPTIVLTVFTGIYIMLALQAKLWIKHFAYEYAICKHYNKSACKKNNIDILKKLFPYLTNIKASVRKAPNKTYATIKANCFGKTLKEKGIFHDP